MANNAYDFFIFMFIVGVVMGFLVSIGINDLRDRWTMIDEFCPQEFLNDRGNMYCEGKPFVCSDEECLYVVTSYRGIDS